MDFTIRILAELLEVGSFVEPDTLVGVCDVTINCPSWETSWLMDSKTNPITPSTCGTGAGLGGSMERVQHSALRIDYV